MSFFRKGDSAPKYMQGSRSMKNDNWILLDNLVPRCGASSGSRIRALQIHSKRSKKHMYMKQHKKHGTLNLPQELHKFNIFRPMHELWKGYIKQVFNASGKNQLARCLLDADPHGAIILVVECKATSFTGVCGIVICETAEAFGIITEDNKFQVVLKMISVFVFHVDCWKVTLHGDKLTSRKWGLWYFDSRWQTAGRDGCNINFLLLLLHLYLSHLCLSYDCFRQQQQRCERWCTATILPPVIPLNFDFVIRGKLLMFANPIITIINYSINKKFKPFKCHLFEWKGILIHQIFTSVNKKSTPNKDGAN